MKPKEVKIEKIRIHCDQTPLDAIEMINARFLEDLKKGPMIIKLDTKGDYNGN